MKKSVFLISFSLLMLIFLLPMNCKSPMSPDEPPQYWAKIEVTYDRDPAKIIFPQGNDKATAIAYYLFDPERKLKSQYDKFIEGYYRVGGVKMEQLGEHKFRGYIEQVFVQKEDWHGKHRIYVRDFKLYDGMNDVSTYTPYGITIEKSYDLSILSYELHFKISKQ